MLGSQGGLVLECLGGQLWSGQQQTGMGHFVGYRVHVVGPVPECAQLGVTVSFGHPDSRETKGGPIQKAATGSRHPKLLSEAAPQCRPYGKALASSRGWGDLQAVS